ncbi:aldehyde dehydrogenase, putative [Bodo saltans]|uniref:Aldehyde dehydrogenase, putative n=1 Tax=Bodo saltans TaxID=75058 RepID=A0A0S4ITF6_BODSA|nr:aldehyde dehydrogenase, putative [Bodo saltans]|eukprot:CUF84277.1 aldehyde dehydrogenase, putative [Bodo saltans]
MIAQTIERYTAPTIKVEAPKTRFDAAPSATQLTPQSAGAGQIQCFDKGTNAPLGLVRAIPTDEVKAIVARARVAQEKWAKTSFSTRRKLMFSLLDYVIANQRLICETASVECGKTMMDGTLGEILTTLEKLRWTAAHGEDVLQEEVRDVGLITMHKRAAVNYVPFGVIGAIVSWNYPFHNIYGPMISALFAGNAFVGKVSEYSSYYAKFYESIVREGLKQLGQSPDLVTFLTGFAETGEALVSSADKITFIGSPGVGKLVMRKASETLTPVVLELGGKDPAIILEDADLEQVIPIVMRGTYQNCGQNCVGLERILVHASIHDKLVNILVEKVKKLTQGAASTGSVKDLGAMTMGPASVKKIQKLVDESVASGAKVLVGGKATTDQFFPPTIMVNVTSKTPIAVEEVFGPILVVMKFSSDEEAIHLVNDCPYGLGSSVFSANTARAKSIADRLKTGMVNVNDFGINYLCQSLPFGGVKVSGFDRFAGREGLRGNCVVRASTTDRIPGVKTVIPPILQYPIQESAFVFMENLVRVLYGTTLQFVTSAVSLATFKK